MQPEYPHPPTATPPPEPGLPPVEPPSGRFIVQLFVVPGLIVLVVVMVLMGLFYLTSRQSPGVFPPSARQRQRRHPLARREPTWRRFSNGPRPAACAGRRTPIRASNWPQRLRASLDELYRSEKTTGDRSRQHGTAGEGRRPHAVGRRDRRWLAQGGAVAESGQLPRVGTGRSARAGRRAAVGRDLPARAIARSEGQHDAAAQGAVVAGQSRGEHAASTSCRPRSRPKSSPPCARRQPAPSRVPPGRALPSTTSPQPTPRRRMSSTSTRCWRAVRTRRTAICASRSPSRSISGTARSPNRRCSSLPRTTATAR